jgi:sortase A
MNPSYNPLFPSDPDRPEKTAGFALPGKGNTISPLDSGDPNQAADLIREKLNRLYADEPSAKDEAREAEIVPKRSKHQQFMHELSTSGRSLADIQTAWHNYYVALPDNEKHEVWQEFYANNERQSAPATAAPAPQSAANDTSNAVVGTMPQVTPATEKPRRVKAKKPVKKAIPRSRQEIKHAILDQVSAGGKLTKKHHFQSLLFGVASGFIVVVIFLFGFFNEVIIAPFIQPSRTAAATPIIVDPDSVEISSTPQIIIPKINVQIPVDYSQTTINDSDIENGLDNGIVHYPTTEKPGQNGNAAFFGHSSNNIFNKGKYKFAFVLLHELVPGDTFYITYSGKTYIYKVIDKKIVDPGAVEVLDDIPGKTATASLITCDPPGTTLHRLVVIGEQISPDPSGNSAGGGASVPTATKDRLPGNGPTLWTRMWRSIF